MRPDFVVFLPSILSFSCAIGGKYRRGVVSVSGGAGGAVRRPRLFHSLVSPMQLYFAFTSDEQFLHWTLNSCGLGLQFCFVSSFVALCLNSFCAVCAHNQIASCTTSLSTRTCFDYPALLQYSCFVSLMRDAVSKSNARNRIVRLPCLYVLW